MVASMVVAASFAWAWLHFKAERAETFRLQPINQLVLSRLNQRNTNGFHKIEADVTDLFGSSAAKAEFTASMRQLGYVCAATSQSEESLLECTGDYIWQIGCVATLELEVRFDMQSKLQRVLALLHSECL